jgi:hypothetical protein
MSDGILRYGGSGSGSVSVSPGHDNFAGAAINGLSLSCTPIELLANDSSDNVVATATGFFWQRSGQSYLVTNWHVVSGRNSFTGKLNSRGYVPKRIRFYGMSVSTSAGVVSFRRQRWTLEWADDMIGLLSTPPQADGQSIDIWGVPIPDGVVFGRDPARTGFNGAAETTCFLDDHVGARIVSNACDDCFILGYPLQNYDGLMPPIWKRGSIASETPLGLDGRPVFLLDAATTAGMSGSPIIRKATTFTAENKDIGALQEFSAYEVIGVYAGRLENNQLAAVNLGYGWYRTMIDRALDHYRWSPPAFIMEPPAEANGT